MFLLLALVTTALAIADHSITESLNTFRNLNGDEWQCPANRGSCGLVGTLVSKRVANSEHDSQRNISQRDAGSLSATPTVSLTGLGLNYAVGSVVLQQRDPGNSGQPSISQPAAITISGIPAGATLVQAIIWAGASSPGTLTDMTGVT